MAEVFSDRRALSRWDLATPPYPHVLKPCRCFLNPVFFLCTQQVTKRLHSGETATAGENGVNRAVIKSLQGGRGGRQRVIAASSLGGAGREQYAAMEAGGGAVAAPP
jgi:hypothetical protein